MFEHDIRKIVKEEISNQSSVFGFIVCVLIGYGVLYCINQALHELDTRIEVLEKISNNR